jgi:hypothetical protein
MAYVTVPEFTWPSLQPCGSNWLYTGSTISASGHLVAMVFQVKRAGTLDWFEWRTQTVSNNPDNGVKTSFMGVDAATGNPDGVVDQYRDNPAALSANTWQVPAGVMTDDGTDGGVKRTVSAGEWLACVIGNVSFTASDSFNVASMNLGTGFSMGGAYLTTYNGTSWSKQTGNGLVIALRYDDGTYDEIRGFNAWPAVSVNSSTFNSGTTPDEKALRFQLPAPMRVIGIAYRGTLTGDADVVLYDSGGSTLATVTADKDLRNGSAAIWNTVYFSSAVELAASTTYRAALKPTSGTNVMVQDLSAGTNARLGTLPTGTACYLSTRTDAGAWTDTNTDLPLIALIVNGVDDGTGGGGGTYTAAPRLVGGGLVG